MFKPEYKYIGIGYGGHKKYKHMVVIDYACEYKGNEIKKLKLKPKYLVKE